MAEQRETKPFFQPLSEEVKGIVSESNHLNPKSIILKDGDIDDLAEATGRRVIQSSGVVFMSIKQQRPDGSIHNGLAYLVPNASDRAMETGLSMEEQADQMTHRVAHDLRRIHNAGEPIASVMLSEPRMKLNRQNT